MQRNPTFCRLWLAAMMDMLLCCGFGLSPTHALTLRLLRVATGLNSPVFVTHAGDDRLFIVERPGRIRVLQQGILLPEPFLDIIPLVSFGGERGLLSVAFHPAYNTPGADGAGLVWVNYTNIQGNTVIARYTVSADEPNRADPTSARILLTIPQPFSNHNGGQLQFGPVEGVAHKRLLYIGMGDGGSGGDPQNNAQNNATVLGKMLRLDPATAVDALPPFYTIPEDNPNPGAGDLLGTIWAKGLRNPWRFTFDALTGALYIADVGQDRWEEINVTPAGEGRGANYGWRITEGNACFNPASGCDTTGLSLPVFAYAHSAGRCSIIGGYVYRGERYPNLTGRYLYADFCTGEIWGLTETSPGTWENALLYDANFLPLSFGEDRHGALYIAGNDGNVYALIDLDVSVPLQRGFNLFSPPVTLPTNWFCNDLQEQTGATAILRLDPLTGALEQCESAAHVFPLEAGVGYVIYMPADGAVVMQGEPSCPVRDLPPGLNLLGTPNAPGGFRCVDILRTAGGPDVMTTLQRFNTATGAFETCGYSAESPSDAPVGVNFPVRSGAGYLLALRSPRATFAPHDPLFCPRLSRFP